MSSDFESSLERLKLAGANRPRSRTQSELLFLDQVTRFPKLLYDTTVYIDVLQDTFPISSQIILQASASWHSTVSEAELVALVGLMHPSDSNYKRVMESIRGIINQRQDHRIIAPDREIWVSAGLLSATLARMQKRSRTDRILLLNDALILETARKHGLSVLTRNINDFDLLQQLEPSAQVIFYERA